MASILYKTKVDKTFEEQYIAARQKEGRIHSVEQLKKLPDPSLSDHFYNEWKIRKNSAERFVYYLHKNPSIKTILEIGCGNGWFCNYLAKYSNAEYITGLDINEFELKQAEEAFDSQKMNWIYADIFEADLSETKYDLIVFNGSIQYFSDLKKVIDKTTEFLNSIGEIHILDSPFYDSEKEKLEARKRSENYYSELGFPEMSKNYFPHSYSEAKELKMEIVFKPDLKLRIATKISGGIPRPFPWLTIKK